MRYLPILVLVACSGLDTSGLPSTDGYTSWKKFGPFTTEIPGHGDTYRVVYANPIAETYDHGGRYPVSSVIVKEIYNKTSSGGPGDLAYTAIMRKIDPTTTSTSAHVDDGWVFSYEENQTEKQAGSCYASCHVQAPYDAAWIDYGD
jgi:hypothetical protein